MQDRYAGDVGDFVKLGLLRHLGSPRVIGGSGLSVALNWYLVPDENHNGDGRHIGYLQPTNPRHRQLAACDKDLIRRLGSITSSGRTVEALELSGALPAGTATYRRVLAPTAGPEGRRQWHREALRKLAGASIIFADPDNGIRMSPGGPRNHKFALLAELADYASRGQSLVVYHHADRSADARTQAQRRLGELADAVGQQPVGAVIAHRGSCRFFLISAAADHWEPLGESIHSFILRWQAHVELVG